MTSNKCLFLLICVFSFVAEIVSELIASEEIYCEYGNTLDIDVNFKNIPEDVTDYKITEKYGTQDHTVSSGIVKSSEIKINTYLNSSTIHRYYSQLITKASLVCDIKILTVNVTDKATKTHKACSRYKNIIIDLNNKCETDQSFPNLWKYGLFIGIPVGIILLIIVIILAIYRRKLRWNDTQGVVTYVKKNEVEYAELNLPESGRSCVKIDASPYAEIIGILTPRQNQR